MKQPILALVAIFGSLGAIGYAPAAPNRTSPTKTIEMLGGRLRAKFPDDAKTSAVQNGIMAAPDAEEDLSRVTIDRGPDRLVLGAYEEFAKAGQDFEDVVRKKIAGLPSKADPETLKLPAGMRGYAYYPAVPPQGGDSNLVMGLYVAQADGTVQRLVMLANKSAAINIIENRKLAHSIAITLSPGRRTLDTDGGDYQLSRVNGSKAIYVTLPPGYVKTVQHGVDFTVHHIRKIMPFGQTPASIGIYVGNYPSRQKGVKQGEGVVFGQQVEWQERVSRVAEGEQIVHDAIVPLNPQGPGIPLFADVFLQAGDRITMERLESLAATLRIEAAK